MEARANNTKVFDREFNPLKNPLVIIAAAMLVVALVFVIIIAVTNGNESKKEAARLDAIKSGVFREGITVNGVDISGMTYANATETLKSVESSITDGIRFVLKYNDYSREINEKDLVITFNTETLLSEAIMIGKDGGYLDTQRKEPVALELDYNVDIAPLFEGENSIATEVNVAPVNATAYLPEGFKPSYSTAVTSSPFMFKEGENGVEVDEQALTQKLTELIENRQFGTEIEIPVKEIAPDINLDKLKSSFAMRSYFKTSYRKGNSYNRVFNIQKAADRLNGTKLGVGETFSMEGTIGRRTPEDGWLPAPAVISGGAATEDQPGGGVCQVSTTLYNCVVTSDLEIVFRRNHSKASSYVDPGLDCTINTDTIDFLFKNNTEGDIYILSWLDRGREDIYCAIYGVEFPDTFDRIVFRSQLKEKIEPTETEYIERSALKPGEWAVRNKAITGYIYESFVDYMLDGKVVNTKYVDKSTYRMHPLRYYVYPGYVPGTALNPALEMIVNADGTFTRKYSTPPPTPTPIQTEAPVVTQPPTTEQPPVTEPPVTTEP